MNFPFKMYGLWNEQRQSGREKKTFNHREWKLLFSISVSNCNFSADFSLYSTWMADCTELRVSIAEHVSWSMPNAGLSQRWTLEILCPVLYLILIMGYYENYSDYNLDYRLCSKTMTKISSVSHPGRLNLKIWGKITFVFWNVKKNFPFLAIEYFSSLSDWRCLFHNPYILKGKSIFC
jgi:hypothetical protein